MSGFFRASPRMGKPTPTEGDAPSHSPADMHYAPGDSLARKMGWFSIALGLAEVLEPDAVSRFAGLRPSEGLRVCGVRELLCGVGILNSKRPAGWMWARAAGDLWDLAHVAMNHDDSSEQSESRAFVTSLALAGVLLVDLAAAGGLSAAASVEG